MNLRRLWQNTSICQKIYHVVWVMALSTGSGIVVLAFSIHNRKGLLSSWCLLAIFCVQAVGLTFLGRLIRRMIHSLNELDSVADAVGRGDFATAIPIPCYEDFGPLADLLNRMTLILRVTRCQKKQAEDTTQNKSLFLANMSHEIRSPLGAILGFVELLKEPTISDQERQQYLDIVERTGESLVTIVDDILDLSKVEAGKLEVEKKFCYLPGILADLENLFRLRCQRKGIYLRCFKRESVPDWIYTDPVRLRQILLNIIGNAIKFTHQGGVTVTCTADENMLTFVVNDTGIGISAGHWNKLFINFSQLDHLVCKNHGGTGLGLSLSRKFAQLLDGDVYLQESQIGVGSTFIVRVALTKAEQEREGAFLDSPDGQSKVELDIQLVGKKIFIVDDSPESQLLIQKFLMKTGAEIEVAGDGLEGIHRAMGKSYDLILMDMQMPVMDGYTATETLRKSGYTKPILGLTAHAMKEDLAQSLRVGCNEVLTKPINREQLLDLVAKYCG